MDIPQLVDHERAVVDLGDRDQHGPARGDGGSRHQVRDQHAAPVLGQGTQQPGAGGTGRDRGGQLGSPFVAL